MTQKSVDSNDFTAVAVTPRTRKRLNLIKVNEDFESIDELINFLLIQYND